MNLKQKIQVLMKAKLFKNGAIIKDLGETTKFSLNMRGIREDYLAKSPNDPDQFFPEDRELLSGEIDLLIISGNIWQYRYCNYAVSKTEDPFKFYNADSFIDYLISQIQE